MGDVWTTKVVAVQERCPRQPCGTSTTSLTEEISVDDDSLLQEIYYDGKHVVKGKQDLNGMEGTGSGRLKATTAPVIAGPTNADLDFQNWGYNCKNIEPSEHTQMATPQAEAQFLALTEALFQNRPAAAAIVHMMNKQKEGRRLQGPPPPEMPGMAKCFMPPLPPSS